MGGLSAARCSTTISKQEETGSDDAYKMDRYRVAAHYFRLFAHPFKAAYINGNSGSADGSASRPFVASLPDKPLF
jgi:hypothetical protein